MCSDSDQWRATDSGQSLLREHPVQQASVRTGPVTGAVGTLFQDHQQVILSRFTQGPVSTTHHLDIMHTSPVILIVWMPTTICVPDSNAFV